MTQLRELLHRAMAENRIDRRDWEVVLDLATRGEEVVLNGENTHLAKLVALLEGGEVAVEGVPQAEVLRRLAVFA